MTQQFHEGQEVEVITFQQGPWSKAKIVRHDLDHPGYRWEVQFPDGTRAVFDEAQIRAAKHIGVASGLASGEPTVRFE